MPKSLFRSRYEFLRTSQQEGENMADYFSQANAKCKKACTPIETNAIK